MSHIRARSPLDSFGIWMIGPALLQFGSEELKQQHLPPIVRGEIRWCQGYSEPGAGSDLAGLQCKGEDRGDHFIANGQKVWTSYGDKADWMFCLLRTDPDAKKQMGISLVLFDMETPGVTPKPIKLISGSSPFYPILRSLMNIYEPPYTELEIEDVPMELSEATNRTFCCLFKGNGPSCGLGLQIDFFGFRQQRGKGIICGGRYAFPQETVEGIVGRPPS